MARSNNLYESTQGKIGNLVFYQLNGKGYVRMKPIQYKDRKSPAQLAQRQRLSVVTEFLRSFSSLLRITFASEAVGRTAMQAAQSYAMHHALEGSYPDIRVKPENVLLSKGPLPLPVQVTTSKHPEGICIEWENGNENHRTTSSDSLIVLARNAATGHVDYRLTGVRRSEGRYMWKTPLANGTDKLPDVWVAFRNKEETEMSDSLFVSGG